MKNSLLCLFLSLFLINNCYGQNLKNNKISDEFLNACGLSQEFLTEWRTDSLGCLGLREKYITYILHNKKLIGISYERFIDIFGLPITNIGNNGIEYFAATDCDEKGNQRRNPDKLGYLEFYFAYGKFDACIFSSL